MFWQIVFDLEKLPILEEFDLGYAMDKLKSETLQKHIDELIRQVLNMESMTVLETIKKIRMIISE